MPAAELPQRAGQQREQVGVAELRALGMTGGPAGVHLNRAVAREDRQARIRRGRTRRPGRIIGPLGMLAVERDDRPRMLQVVRDLFDRAVEIGADEQQLGLRVVRHEGDLRRGEPKVDRHQHRIGLGGPEPKLEERRAVLGQDRDARLRSDAGGDQRVGNLVGAPIEIPVGNLSPLEMDGDGLGARHGMATDDVGDRRHAGNFQHDRSSQILRQSRSAVGKWKRSLFPPRRGGSRAKRGCDVM